VISLPVDALKGTSAEIVEIIEEGVKEGENKTQEIERIKGELASLPESAEPAIRIALENALREAQGDYEDDFEETVHEVQDLERNLEDVNKESEAESKQADQIGRGIQKMMGDRLYGQKGLEGGQKEVTTTIEKLHEIAETNENAMKEAENELSRQQQRGRRL
jgi:hypothetical protein